MRNSPDPSLLENAINAKSQALAACTIHVNNYTIRITFERQGFRDDIRVRSFKVSFLIIIERFAYFSYNSFYFLSQTGNRHDHYVLICMSEEN